MLYLGDGLIRFQYPECLQGALNDLMGLFYRVGLMSNIENSRTMTFQPGAIHTGMLDKAINSRIVGVGATYRERLRLRIPCLEYRVELISGSMMDHHRRLHGT